MRLTLQAAADFIRTGRARKLVMRLIRRARTIITFEQEHSNRIPRFVAVANEYRRGRPVGDIQAEFGCSRGTVLRYARMAELPKRPKGFDPEVRRAVLAMYEQRKPIAEISAALGVSQAYISKTATEEGINRHKFKRAAR